jgi:copper chaperone CopZ
MKHFKIFIWAVVLLTATTVFVNAQTENPLKSVSLKVKGLHCADDVKTISEGITKLNGVTSCTAGNPGATTSFTVKFDPARVSETEIRKAIENTGGCDNPEEKPYKVKK